MIEGVTSSVANAQVAKAVVQPPVSASLQQNEGQQTEPPKAPYISPFVKVDTQANKAVIQIRDSETGDVLQQYPSESAIKARQIAEAERERAQASRQTSQQQNAQQDRSRGVQAENTNNDIAQASAQTQQAISALNAASTSSQASEAQTTTSVTA